MLPTVSGLFAGVAHVAAGPDHLAAVAPFAIAGRRRYSAPWVGTTWGLGHGVGVLILGALGQALKAGLGIEVVSGWAELFVGCMLIGLGLWTLGRARSIVIHEHTHVHDGHEHTHLHVHAGDADGGQLRRHEHRPHEHRPHEHRPHEHRPHEHRPHEHGHATFGIGMLHGLAGSGHLVAVMPSLTMEPREAAFYLGGYLVAAVFTMALFGALVGWILRVAGSEKVPLALKAAGWACLAVGVVWIVTSLSMSQV